MAYAAVVSLAQTLNQLLHSDSYHFDYPKPQIESLYVKVCFLQSCLEEISPAPWSRRVEANDLEIQIRDAIYKAQDTIELFISSQIRSSEIPAGDRNSCSVLLEDIIAELDPMSETAKSVVGWIRESKEDAVRSDLMSEKPHISSSRSAHLLGLSSRSAHLLGREDDCAYVLDKLVHGPSQIQVIAISGMGGVGKTFLVRDIYQQPLTIEFFDIRCWVTVSQEYHVRTVLLSLLGFMNQSVENKGMSDDELGEYLHKYLYGRRYLFVMDDIWDELCWSKVRPFLPENNNGSCVLVTTRLANVAENISYVHLRFNPLDQDTSWRLLCKTVFGDEDCPPELKNVGRNIAKKCRGIALTIVVVGGLLAKFRTVDHWKDVEKGLYDDAAGDEEQILMVLSLSYSNLPSRLKACFLYLGAFPQDSEILISKLIKLWVAEGFLATPSSLSLSLEENAHEHLKELIDRNLISIRKSGFHGRAKTCSVHDSLRKFALGECRKENFFHTINRYAQPLLEGTESQRRICVHKNALMCAKDVYLSARSIEHARTLLYAGPNHHHPLPFFLSFDLLRVLDALAVYFIELPNALFELIHLRYLAFTYDEDIPPSISNLRNLLILVVRQHPKIIIRRPLILPAEIWNMSQIRHLLLSETVLPDPCGSRNSVLLESLQSLSNISAVCCTKEMLRNMPNLKKLGMWIEFPSPLLSFLDQLPCLEALKFTVLKPVIGEKIDFMPKLVFPNTLKRLSLSGCGLPWEDMTIIGQLPHLEALKLRELAFQGPVWSPIEGEFYSLKFLLLESLELVDWTADSSHFPMLEHLIIRHCYELEEISSGIGEIATLQLIKLVHCSPSAVLSACIILEVQESFGYEDIKLDIHSSRECQELIKEELKDSDYKDLKGINFSWE